MSNHTLQLIPRDLLFMHDARPMEASDAGLGANWPRPDQLYHAIIHAFRLQWPERMAWEGEKHTFRSGIDAHADSPFRFGALKVAGPFPKKTASDGRSHVYFPCPLDLSADDEGNVHPMKLVSAEGMNMPLPLRSAFQAQCLGKASLPQWLSAEDYEQYLRGKSFRPEKTELYSAERNYGVAIDGATGAAKEGQLYQAEYLRLASGVSLAFMASCGITAKGRPLDEKKVDVFEKLPYPAPVLLGGQQGMARLEEVSEALPLPRVRPGDSRLVRWTLLTPMISTNGWLPGWIDGKSGDVQLKARRVGLERRAGESRAEWRRRLNCEPSVHARLIAARIGKPMYFSGWDMKTCGPKPTFAAVPAGSSYIFECASTQDVQELWNVLDCQSAPELIRQSSQFGEKGFGLGVCSTLTC